ncbi:hypothetical protein [Plantactinospora sp. GCM10030261]|uniref:hypothetical protein n=1 Tax=Plantactinospora sp. GCM10030261 TaxID=3273420 RepID=UPI00362274CD
MLIDCDSCPARGAAAACAGCLVSALDETPDQGLTTAEERAIEVFARAGFDVEVLSAPPAAPVRLVPRRRRGRHVA